MNQSTKVRLYGSIAVAVVRASLLCAQARDSSWLAFRVDSNHIVTFFQTATLKGAPRDRPLNTKATFFDPVLELPETYVQGLPGGTRSIRVSVGDRLQLSLDSGAVATVTVTSFAGGVGFDTNDSYLGGVALIPSEAVRFFTGDVYAISRTTSKLAPRRRSMLVTSVNADTRSRIRAAARSIMLQEHRPMAAQWTLAQVDITEFYLANGARRYYSIATWKGPGRGDISMLSSWLDDTFKARSHSCACPLREAYPDKIVNVVALPGGKTGLIVSQFAPGYLNGFALVEYQEQRGLPKLIYLQTLGAGG